MLGAVVKYLKRAGGSERRSVLAQNVYKIDLSYRDEVDRAGGFDISSNNLHPDLNYENYAIGIVGTVLLVLACLCVCLLMTCCKLRARHRLLHTLARSKATLAGELAQAQRMLRQRNREILAASPAPEWEDMPILLDASCNPMGRSAARAHALPAWDVMLIEEGNGLTAPPVIHVIPEVEVGDPQCCDEERTHERHRV